MGTSREEMCKSLNDWFTVFYNENCVSQSQREKRFLNDLTDGVAMASALKQLAPDYFTGKYKNQMFSKWFSLSLPLSVSFVFNFN